MKKLGSIEFFENGKKKWILDSANKLQFFGANWVIIKRGTPNSRVKILEGELLEAN